MSITFQSNTAALIRQMRSRAQSAVSETAEFVAEHARTDMARAKHGRAYPRPGGRVHIASAPGESPAIDTGYLESSIEVDVNGLTAVVGTNEIGRAHV